MSDTLRAEQILEFCSATAGSCVPGATEPTSVTVEVDHATFTTASDAWFTLCDSPQPRCWIGHGGAELIEVPSVAVASFLPLDFSPGG